MNLKLKYGNIIFVILIYVQIILLKGHITRDMPFIPLIESVYFVIVIASLFLLKLLDEIKKLTTINKIIYFGILILIFVCFISTKSRNIPAGNIIEKGRYNDYYVILNIRNSEEIIKLYCDKFKFDLISESDNYANISFTTSPFTKKNYLKSFQVIK
ncbi:hypothetical protein [Anaerocolumna aminovalerica]|jgi:hypothetical protein|uniref:hypothetical protein n=1 Tax=Anaerocolumna aminovalerica TaxID=1527 RepID=UPI00248AB057|nr:hypothetical protein [Anaerocolumna aminovalerica]